MDSRSARLRSVIRLSRALELESAYELAWTEWDDSDDGRAWEAVAGDGEI